MFLSGLLLLQRWVRLTVFSKIKGGRWRRKRKRREGERREWLTFSCTRSARDGRVKRRERVVALLERARERGVSVKGSINLKSCVRWELFLLSSGCLIFAVVLLKVN